MIKSGNTFYIGFRSTDLVVLMVLTAESDGARWRQHWYGGGVRLNSGWWSICQWLLDVFVLEREKNGNRIYLL